MTRVAYVIWSLGLGGAEQVVIRLAAGLDRRRFEPLICCLDERGSFATQAEDAGVEVVAMGKRGPLDAGAAHRLARLLRSRRIQVVHTHLWGGNVWGRLAALWARVPTIVASEHNLDTWKKRHHFLIDRALAPATTRLVAVSGQVRDFYEARGVGRGRWQVVYNGVDAHPGPARGRGAARRELGLPADAPVVALIGRLVPAKAPDVFLRAVAQAALRVPTLSALIVGDGPLRAELEGEAQRLGLAGRVVFLGVRKDVPELLSGLDAVLFSSVREGFSLTMLEAMAAGVPVIATEVGGTPELITHGRTGLLVPPGQPEQLAQALVGLLLDPAGAAAIRAAARKSVEERFSLSSMVEAHAQIYEGPPPVEVRPA
ncbi:MAG: glycosyltransferase [Solirubrobacterales bacterium]|jgi:glycosyltransferase involved in cell wall biosynthesis